MKYVVVCVYKSILSISVNLSDGFACDEHMGFVRVVRGIECIYSRGDKYFFGDINLVTNLCRSERGL